MAASPKPDLSGVFATPKPTREPGQAWSIAPVQTKEHQVAELLREKIIAGSVVRGQKLKQAELAKMLNVSITPVREALRLLEAEGYVHVSSHRGAIVAPFQIDQVEELFDLRMTLEGKLTTAAARRISPADLEGLVALNENIRVAAARNAREDTRGSNFRFHFRLYECAGMPHTLEFVRVLWAKYPFDLLGSIPGRPPRVVDEHAALLAALKERDPRKAVKAMQAHIASGHRDFKATYALEPRR
ncbi:MAG TPA: GntR family transcriptional regulator [Rhodopila sp.]|uniref:GntR family transcriptional regulator n=1 Tax=Rhodopila sp. TaxID=2480087 RepID=UPI002BA8FFE6|nr:GntR family transcriptional regulator [Rhodopila sp.]HVY16960.1 GntR family transcriptional regulator [Rhodopila sp.]